MKPRVLAVLLLALAAPLPAQSVSATSLLPGDGAIAPAAANQRVPALAAGGDLVLAVWQDARTSPIVTGEQAGEDIWATRLDAQGVPVDDVPFPVTMAGGSQSAPRVAWNGSHWLVAWVGQVSTQFYSTDALLAARVAPDGTVLDTEPIVVQAEMGSGTFGDVASDGNGWAVFFTGWDAGAISSVYGVRIAANGTVLDGSPKVIASPGGSPSTPYGVSADWATGRYLVAWFQWASGLDDVRARLADANLTPVGSTFNVATSADYEVHPQVASNGAAFYVVWDRYNNCCVGGASAAYGTRVTTAGAVLDGTSGVAIYDINGYGFQGCDPAVAWDGLQWIASWTEPDSGVLAVNAARISATGVVLDFNGFAVEPMPQRQEVSALVGLPGGGSLLAWQDSRASVGQAYDIYAARITTGGLAQPMGSLADGLPSQVRADAASGPGDSALLAWTSMISGSSRVLVQRVDGQGQPIDLPLEVASGLTLGDVHIAWNGSRWLVTWDGPGGIFARRLDSSGLPLDGAPFFVMPGFDNDVAGLGDVFLVTALVPESNPEYVDVLSRRVSASTGAVLDGASVFVGNTYARAQTVEAFDGGFLVAWQRHSTHDQPYSSIWLRQVSVANVPGSQTSFSTSSSYNQLPAIAVGDLGALLVWQLGPESSTNQDVLARLVAPGPTLPGGNIVVSAEPLLQQAPSLAWDGTQYVVTWQDGRADAPDYLFDRRTDVYFARVTEAGAVLDPGGVPLATDDAPEAWPTVAPLADGTALLAWSDFQQEAPFASYRIATAVLGAPQPWTDLGGGCQGAFGEPVLAGDGPLTGGSLFSLQLGSAPPTALALLWVGTSSMPLSVFGGTLHAFPFVDQVLLGTDTAGAILGSATWPVGMPAGTAVYFQFLVQDGSVPAGIILSNGLKATTP